MSLIRPSPTTGILTYIPPPPLTSLPSAPTPPHLPLKLKRSLLLSKLARRPSEATCSTPIATFTREDLSALVQTFLLSSCPSSEPSGNSSTPHRFIKPFLKTFLYVSQSLRGTEEEGAGELFLECLPKELRVALRARCGCAPRVKVPAVLLGKRRRIEKQEECAPRRLPQLETLVEVAIELLGEARQVSRV